MKYTSFCVMIGATLALFVSTPAQAGDESKKTTAKEAQSSAKKQIVPHMEGKWARSPKGQLVAFIRVPDRGPTELWVRHTRNGSVTLLRRGYLGIRTANIRKVRIDWEGNRIRLQDAGQVSYIDLRGRLVKA